MRVGIVGAGAMGQRHAAAWTKAGGSVVGVTSRTAPRAEELASSMGARAYSSLEAMLPALDVVDICTPSDAHAAYICQAARAGKQVVCEKPLALSLEQGMEAARTCQEHGVHLYVGHVLRYFPEYVRARQLATSGELGRLGVMRLSRGGYRFKSGRDAWFQDENRSGGIFLDLMVHDLDYARWVAGDVESVYARHIPSQVSSGRYDYAIAILHHHSGVLSQVVGAWIYNPPNFRTSFELACERGLIQHHSDGESALVVEMETDGSEHGVIGVPGSPLHENPYVMQLKDFISWVEGGPPPRASTQDALAALQLALAARQSIQSGQPVTIQALAEVQA